MRKRLSVVWSLLAICSTSLLASQFIAVPFEEVVHGSVTIVRGTVGPVTAAWDSSGEIIYSSAPLYVGHYVKGDGPAVLQVREVGGMVGDYTQQAIGFPELREGEEVVLFLSRWEDDDSFRIHAYARGKFLVVRDAGGHEIVVPDRMLQGEPRRAAAATDGAAVPLERFVAEVREIVRERSATTRVRN